MRPRTSASVDPSEQSPIHLRPGFCDKRESTTKTILSHSVNDKVPRGPVAGTGVKNGSDAVAACAGLYDFNGKWNKAPSLLDDSDEDLNFEIALGLFKSGLDSVDGLDDSTRLTPVGFQNRFDSLSKCNNINHPMRAHASSAGSEAVSQHDDSGAQNKGDIDPQ